MKLLYAITRMIVTCLCITYVSFANAEQGASIELCDSINGIYQFFGQDDDGDPHIRSLTEVLSGPLLLSGKAIATELLYDSTSSLLRIRVRRENLEPDPDFSLPVKCIAGVVTFEDRKDGHADGSTYDMKSSFRFWKDSAGVLVVHKTYTIKSTNLLFFSKERSGDEITRFSPIKITN